MTALDPDAIEARIMDIKSISGTVLFSCEATTMRDALENAVAARTDLAGANLAGANLRYADLTDANLEGANLEGADLRYADLTGANLAGVNLTTIRNDLFTVLDSASAEVPGLLSALREGRVDGSSYEGECACLVGTIANVAHVHYEAIPNITPDSGRPIERFFLDIAKGDTPETNPIARVVEGWIVEWQKAQVAT